MSKKTLQTVLMILLLVVVLFTIVKYAVNGNRTLISPVPLSIPIPQTPSYNPPVEIKYDSSTDLKKELENINPQVSDSDFE